MNIAIVAPPPNISSLTRPSVLHEVEAVKSVQSKKEYSPLRKLIRNKIPPIAYSVSSVIHMLTAGVLAMGNFSNETKKLWTQRATAFTKLINSLVYTDLAVEAAQNGFAFDFLGRIAEPIMNIFVDLNHYHLFRTFSSALNQLHSINLSRVKQGAGLWQNFIDNLHASKEFIEEIWMGKGGSFNERLFGGEKDKGHTLAFASHLQMAVGIFALLNGIKRNFLNRALGVVRNVAGIMADIGLLFERDYSAKRVGFFYLLHAAGDTIKRFIPDEVQDLLDNMIMPFYNAGLYYFGIMGRRQSDGTYLSHDNSDSIRQKEGAKGLAWFMGS